jgi:hypothetical protein
MIDVKRVALSRDSEIMVLQPEIGFFIEKIKQEEYFSFTRQLHGFWDAIISALILEKDLRSIEKYDDSYLLRLSEAMVRAKSDIMPLHYDKYLYFDVLKYIIHIDEMPGELYFGVSDVDFYPQEEPPYSTKSYAGFFPTHHLLPISDHLKCYKISCGDRQEIIRYFLPEGYTPFNGIIWRRYSYFGMLKELLEAVKSTHAIVIIGPSQFREFGFLHGITDYHHIEIHNTDASYYREDLLAVINDYHADHYLKNPIIYFIVAGVLGVWLVSKLHHNLKRAFIIDIGLGLDPLLPKTKIKDRNPYHFLSTVSDHQKDKSETGNFFINKDLGCRLKISPSGNVQFHMKEISSLKCRLLVLKTRFEFIMAYRVKTYRLKKYWIFDRLIRLYWSIVRSF